MRADAIWTFFKKVTKCRLLFLSKSDLRIFEKPGETKILTDGTVAEISFCPAGVQRAEPFVQGMQRGGSSMLGLRGKAHYRVKGETQEADNGKTTDKGRMGKKQNEKM